MMQLPESDLPPFDQYPHFQVPRMDHSMPPAEASRHRNEKVLTMIKLLPFQHKDFFYAKVVHTGEAEHCGLCKMVADKNLEFGEKPRSFVHHYVNVIDRADGEIKTLRAPAPLMHTLQKMMAEAELARQEQERLLAAYKLGVSRFKKNKLEKRRGRSW
jgi:thiol-disulfide isomerase/thioredoxin